MKNRLVTPLDTVGVIVDIPAGNTLVNGDYFIDDIKVNIKFSLKYSCTTSNLRNLNKLYVSYNLKVSC